MKKLKKTEIGDLKEQQKNDVHPIIEIKMLTPDEINILTQVRRHFDEGSLDILATDIAVNGIINMPNIIFYPKDKALLYIKTINTIHGSNHSLKNMVISKDNGIEGYYFLVAGERRSRAFQILKKKACLRCRAEKENLIKEKGAFEVCFKTHFRRDDFLFPYKLMKGISPFKALNIQMSENLYEKPSSHQEALMYASYYKLLKLINQNYTVAKFSRRVARNSRILSEFIGYIDLSKKIQKYVEEKVIPFGIAKELVFLKNQLKKIGKSDCKTNSIIDFAFTHAVSARMKVSKFKKYVRTVIKEQTYEQPMLFELKPPQFRHVVDPLTKIAVIKEDLYIKNVLRLINDGFIKEDDEILIKNPDLLELISSFVKSNKKILSCNNKQRVLF
jgi:hypothetical protein